MYTIATIFIILLMLEILGAGLFIILILAAKFLATMREAKL